MFRPAIAALILGLGLAPIPAGASGDEVYVLHGACTNLVVGGRNMTQACKGVLTSFTLANGRVGFTFVIADAALMFAGPGPRQVHLKSGRVLQPIDRARFVTGDDPVASPASGSCTYGDPFSGTTRISCRVNAGKGLWIADFVTDGARPVSSGEAPDDGITVTGGH